MGEINFALPAGIFHTGTERMAAGRWYSGNLVRWTSNTLRPIYCWNAHSPSAVVGSPRALIAWKDNLANSWIGIGTHNHLYIMSKAGTLFDVTPTGFTAGSTNATFATGYGFGTYGTGTYGTPRPDTTSILDATVWSLDTFGQNLVGCTPDDRFLYTWVAPTTSTIAAKIANAPQADALVVTAEGFIFALATTDPRTVSWCDQRNSTVWTPTATNQAGSFPLQTFGKVLCGKRLAGGTGIWTDTDLWVATYIGGTLIYGFNKIGNGCGVVSRQAVAVSNSQAVWMGPNGFWLYNGFVSALKCDVQDYVFSNINRSQISKVTSVLNTQYGEVWWFYPSAGSNENDSAVVWNYNDNFWMTHAFARTAGSDSGGAFSFPLMVSPTDNLVYEHETGFSYGGAVPYVESGPLEFAPIKSTYSGEGARVWQANAFVPDELLEGDVQASFKYRIYPNSPELVAGPYTLKPQTDVRFTARQAKLRITAVNSDDWRFGGGRLEIKGSGNR